jgi:hypothetical protein
MPFIHSTCLASVGGARARSAFVNAGVINGAMSSMGARK